VAPASSGAAGTTAEEPLHASSVENTKSTEAGPAQRGDASDTRRARFITPISSSNVGTRRSIPETHPKRSSRAPSARTELSTSASVDVDHATM